MPLTSHIRGHKIEYIEGRGWVYADDKTPIDRERPCKRCGKMPTPEGYDFCLGYIPGGVKSACCGHGVEKGFIMYNSGQVVFLNAVD